MLKDVFCFAEHQEEALYGLGFKISLTGNKNEVVLDNAPGIAEARFKIDQIPLYVPRYTPSIPQQGILSKQILFKTPTELRYIERSVFMKEVKN